MKERHMTKLVYLKDYAAAMIHVINSSMDDTATFEEAIDEIDDAEDDDREELLSGIAASLIAIGFKIDDTTKVVTYVGQQSDAHLLDNCS